MVRFKKFKLTVLFFVAFLSCCFFNASKALAITKEELKSKYISYGGSAQAFDEKILKAVEESQNKLKQLQAKIAQKYNNDIYKVMTADTFNASAYAQIYSKLEQEKIQLVKESLRSMVFLLQSLSPNDRKAYAKLLFSDVAAIKDASSEDKDDKKSTSSKAVADSKDSNKITKEQATTKKDTDKKDTDKQKEETKKPEATKVEKSGNAETKADDASKKESEKDSSETKKDDA